MCGSAGDQLGHVPAYFCCRVDHAELHDLHQPLVKMEQVASARVDWKGVNTTLRNGSAIDWKEFLVVTFDRFSAYESLFGFD